jgi:TRAP-type C4-dicarboxylate transport system permease large subunit
MLTAIPVFIMMGELLLRSGIADGMYKGLSIWLTGLPGGLLHSNIGCCALFAATTGSSVACAATIGTVALPELDKRGTISPGVGTLATRGAWASDPPSIALLVYGSLTTHQQAVVGGSSRLSCTLLRPGLFQNWGKQQNQEQRAASRGRHSRHALVPRSSSSSW